MPFKRTLTPPRQSFFLFGPRGTGKSTWLQTSFLPQLKIDLLSSREFLELSGDPSILKEKVEALSRGSKVVIDEVQKIPAILDEVHRIIFEYGDDYQFALTGSSARKLKRNHANMLAGRAIQRQFFALTSQEMGEDFAIEKILKWGSLPRVLNLKDDSEKKDYLHAYVETYLREEIQAEAAVRSFPSYHRFLKHAALMNGQILNINNISRDAAVARSTLDAYFSIVEETLLGTFIEPIHLKAKVKEISTPKFYFFDCGVVRAIRNDLDETLAEDKGALFETFILNELRAYSSYHRKDWEIYYWGTPSGTEVDFVICKGKKKWALEVKASRTWKKEFNKGLHSIADSKKIEGLFGVYLGKDKHKTENVTALPVEEFCRQLHSGKIFG
jgi:predicted AAA+ superfamily ATPase